MLLFFAFQLMARSQGARSIVNIGCLYKLIFNNIVERARIVYGGLSTTFLRARATETFLIGKPLFTNITLQAALLVLDGEMTVDASSSEASVAYRRYVAKALFFKVSLFHAPYF